MQGAPCLDITVVSYSKCAACHQLCETLASLYLFLSINLLFLIIPEEILFAARH